MGRRRRTVVGMLAGGLLGALGAGTASAARYHVYSCHRPNGLVAPIDGWAGTASDPSAEVLDECGTATDALVAALDGSFAHPTNTSHAVWSFATAPNLALVGATLYRHEAVPGGVGPNATYATVLATLDLTAGAAGQIDGCAANLACAGLGIAASGFDPGNRVTVGPAGPGPSLLLMEAFCIGADGQACPPSPGYAAEADLYAADLTLEDDVGPAPSNVGGSLVAGGTLTGSADLRFAATDDGSGVYSAGLSVDGKPVIDRVIDDNGGQCESLGLRSDGERDFVYQRPCLSATHADLALDTSALADGTHTVSVSVDDAAGNSTPVYSGTIVTRNAPEGGVPLVTGVMAHGQRLVADPGTWNPVARGYAYQWLRCDSTPSSCQAIPGATGSVYVPVAADDYRMLAVEVTAYDQAGSTPARSALAGPVADQNGNVVAGGSVTAQSGGLTGAGKGTSPGGGAATGHVANGSGGGCATPHLTAGFGSSGVVHVRLGAGATLRGRLACAGHPVAGAAIDASVARRGEPGPPATVVLRSGADGSFSMPLAPGPSRELTLTYRATTDASAPSASAVAALEVTPAIGLTIRPARVRNGQTITYTGAVFGGYIPAIRPAARDPVPGRAPVADVRQGAGPGPGRAVRLPLHVPAHDDPDRLHLPGGDPGRRRRRVPVRGDGEPGALGQGRPVAGRRVTAVLAATLGLAAVAGGAAGCGGAARGGGPAAGGGARRPGGPTKATCP